MKRISAYIILCLSTIVWFRSQTVALNRYIPLNKNYRIIFNGKAVQITQNGLELMQIGSNQQYFAFIPTNHNSYFFVIVNYGQNALYTGTGNSIKRDSFPSDNDHYKWNIWDAGGGMVYIQNRADRKYIHVEGTSLILKGDTGVNAKFQMVPQ